MFTQEFTVIGLNCGHCVSTLTEEFDGLRGVQDVAVDLDSGRVTLTSEGHIDQSDVRRVVAEAGFAVATPVGG
jgi:copper chaperone CopZ